MSEELTTTSTDLRSRIINVIKTIYDPEIPVDIYDLGLIYEIKIDAENNNVDLLMTLTSPNCPVAGSLPGEVEEKVKSVKGVGEVTLELTFEPAWDKSLMSEAAMLHLGLM